MKKVVLFLYAASVLLFSGFVRASTLDVPIKKIDFSEGSWQIRVAAQLPNPCLGKPLPVLIADEKTPHVFVMKMVAERKSGSCISIIGPISQTMFDIRQLVFNSVPDLAPEQVYVIRASGYDFEVSFVGQDVVIAPPRRHVDLQ